MPAWTRKSVSDEAVVLTSGALVPVTEIKPLRGWRSLGLADVWHSRELIGFMAARDLKVRYKQTVLGAFWAILQPLATVLVFTVIFGGVAGISSDGVPYAVFAMAGLVPWTFFSAGINRSSSGLAGAAGMVSKVYFPRLVLPLASIAVPLADLALSSLVLLVLMVWHHQPLELRALLVFPLLVIALTASLGFGLLVSAMTIRYRDLGHALPFLIQLGMYATPVIYPIGLLRHKLDSLGLPVWILGINPMSGVVAGFRDALFGSHDLTPGLLISSTMVAVSALIAGAFVFRRAESTVVDII
jgi:lipopolysaccharide transport system permease protein